MMSDEQRNMFVDSIEVANYKRGDIVFEEGDMANYVMYILEGKVKFLVKAIDGKQRIISIKGEHEWLALQASFTNGYHNTTAQVTSDATIIKLPHHMFLKLVDENHDFSRYVINKIATSLDAVIHHMLSFQRKHLRGRLADSLLYLIDKFGFEDDGKTLCVYPSREDLANNSNMDISNAIRTLSAFASEGIITIKARRISIIDIEKLRWISAKE